MEQKILTPNQQKILLRIKQNSYIVNNFYLTGGTALSHYYLKHRLSEDLDFFCKQELNASELSAWAKNIKKSINSKTVEYQTLQGQFIYYFHFRKEIIKVDFAYFPFDHIGTFHHDGKLRVASLLDIGTNKLQAIITRKRNRDFVDLFEIIHCENITLADLISAYRLKFDTYIQNEEWAKHFAGVLDAVDQPRFLGNRNWPEVENYFLKQAKTFSGKVLI